MAKPYKRGGIYWIAPMVNGVQKCMSTKIAVDSPNARQRAIDMLIDIENRARHGEAIPTKIGTLLIDELFDDYERHYLADRETGKNTTYKKVASRLKNLRDFFTRMRVNAINNAMIDRYKEKRQAARIKHNTVAGELGYLRAAVRYGIDNGKLFKVPWGATAIPKWKEKETQWFMPLRQFEQLLKQEKCNDLMKALLTVAYVTGWRIGTVMKIEWSQVDLTPGTGSVFCYQSKNKVRCVWALDDVKMLRDALEERRRYTEEQERTLGKIIPYVFHRKGKLVKDFNRRWYQIRAAAGMPTFVIHDFRGTATVNLLRAGVNPISVMLRVGFETINMVQHYAHRRMDSDALEVAESGRLLQSFYEKQQKVAPVVTTFRTTKTGTGDAK